MIKYPDLHLFIEGEWLRTSRETLAVVNPATEEVLGQLPLATEDDVDRAISAAHRSFPLWRRTPAIERARILLSAAATLRNRTPELAAVITQELGKPLKESERDVGLAAEMFEWAAEEARRVYGRLIPGRMADVRQVVTFEPVGPVAAFSGWNSPAVTPSRKIASALAAGCTLVIKPAEETPAVALEIARALEEAGLPAGVLNMVFGNPATISRQLLESPLIRAATFTGSTTIGRNLAQTAARHLKRITLELGGHAPVLVFPDADIKTAAQLVAAAKFRNSGQICTSPTRMYVHEAVYQTFTDSLVEQARALRVGNGFDHGVTMGPLANSRRLEAMLEMSADALCKGAKVLTGGERIGNRGFFWSPTVISDFNDECIAANVEPFGPMALVSSFSSTDQAIEQANRLPYGLASYVFGEHMRTVKAVSEALENGVVCVNHCQASLPETPFGGVRDSGMGREGGTEGLHEFLQIKYISQRY